MAKALANLALFVPGDPAQSDPDSAFMSYTVEEDSAKKCNCIYDVPSPVWTKTGDTFWDDVITAIKTLEGI